MEIQPTTPQNQWTFRRTVVATLALVGVGLGFLLLYRFYQVLFILFVAIILGTIIRPIANWLTRRGFQKVSGVVAVYIFIFALLTGFLLLLFPLVFDQGSAIVKDIPDYYQTLKTWVQHSPNQLISSFVPYLPDRFPGFEKVVQSDTEMLASTELALRYMSSIFKGFFIILVTLLLSFHWTLYGPQSIESLLLLFPKNQRENHSEMITAIESKMGYYIAGQGASMSGCWPFGDDWISVDWLTQCFCPGTRGGHIGSCSHHWTYSGCHPGRVDCLFDIPISVNLGNYYYSHHPGFGK